MIDLFFRLKNTKHEILKKYVKNPSVIFEIGSHLGTDTVKLKKNFPQSEIYCFEPDPRSLHIFEKYHKDLDVNLIPVAASNENGIAKLYQSYSKEKEDFTKKKYSHIKEDDIINYKLSRCGASSLRSGHEALIDAETVDVKTVKLDDWSKNNNINHIDLIWLDVQGNESNVFDGAQEILSNTKFIWTEFGEKDYDGAMNWFETKLKLEKHFKLINFESFLNSKGDMFFVNKNFKI